MVNGLNGRSIADQPGLADVLALTPSPDRPGEMVSAGGDTAHLFGGLLAATAVRAAAASIDEGRPVHSAHCHFLRAGDGRQPVVYAVEPVRDGGRFSTRRVVASQDGEVVFLATLGFHATEDGPTYLPPGDPAVAGPEGLPPGRYDSRLFDSRDVPVDGGGPGDGGGGAGPADATRWAWFRARQPVRDDPGLHAAGIVFLTDHGATRGVRQPHAAHPQIEQRRSVSLDHTVWLHGTARVDEWVLIGFRAVATGGGRGLTFGQVRTAEGRLVASVAQEALMRLPG